MRRRAVDAPPETVVPPELTRCVAEDWVSPTEWIQSTSGTLPEGDPLWPHLLEAYSRWRAARRAWLAENGPDKSLVSVGQPRFRDAAAFHAAARRAGTIRS